jgi:hypothetical protein
MDTNENNASRDAIERFMPGQSGNPALSEASLRLTLTPVSSKPREAGKRPGTRNRATLLRAALAEGEDVAAARIVIDKALSGDAVAARFLLDRLTPRPRGRAIALDLPAGTGAGDVVAAFDATLQAMAAGEITPDEALTVTRVLDGKVKALKARQREQKLGQRITEKSPSPLARPSTNAQEGRGEGAAPTNILHRDETPHPPIACAMGPFLSRPFDKSSGGRGEDERFRARLLHSTCISPSPAATWRAGLAASPRGEAVPRRLVGGGDRRLC